MVSQLIISLPPTFPYESREYDLLTAAKPVPTKA